MQEKWNCTSDSGGEGEELDICYSWIRNINDEAVNGGIWNDTEATISTNWNSRFSIVPGTPDGWTPPINPDDLQYEVKYNAPATWEILTIKEIGALFRSKQNALVTRIIVVTCVTSCQMVPQLSQRSSTEKNFWGLYDF